MIAEKSIKKEKNIKKVYIEKQKRIESEIISYTKWSNVFITIMSIILIVSVVNFGAMIYLRYYTINRGYRIVKEKWKLLHNLKSPVDWIILGDSSCNQGVIPNILAKYVKGKAVNLCTVGDMITLDDFWMFETYMQRFGAPKNMLIVHSYDIWHRSRPPSVLLAKVSLPWGFWKEFSSILDIKYQDIFTMFSARYFPLYSENETLKKRLFSIKNLFNDNFHLELNGYMPWNISNPLRVQKDAKNHISFTSQNTPKISEINRVVLSKITEIADRYGINVYIVNGPLYEGLFDNGHFTQYFRQIQKELNDLLAQNKRVRYLDEIVLFPADQMENADHTIHGAARVYTTKIASEIARLSP